MAENLFRDFPERVDQLTKYSDIHNLVLPLEEVFGEKGFYKDSEEAMSFYLSVMDELGKMCAKDVKPSAAAIDREGAKYQDGEVILPETLTNHLKKFCELGVFSGQVARRYGGFNLPRSVQILMLELFGHACPNTGLTVAVFSMSDFIEQFGTEEQKMRYIPKFMNLELTTSMALTEAGAGSDLGKLRTSARREDDHYLINGTKQFITNGNSDVVFTLARTDPTSTGLSGLSVLIVHKEHAGKPNLRVTKIEDKVCLHASPTCELVFENSVGHLLGPEGQGFKVMLELMNGARLAMASLANGIATSAVEEAKQYAKTRVTMGKPIIQHPMVADMLYEAELEIRAMRSMVAEAGVAFDWMNLYRKTGDEKNYERWKMRYRRLTPLAKYYCSEKAITIAKNCLQILGGYGVCREYPLERIMRETLIYPIYEGTSQIQSLMVLKDTLKDVAQQAGGFLGSLAGAWTQSLLTRDPVKAKLLQARNELNQGIKTILMSIIRDKFKSDIEALKEKKIQEFVREFSLQLLSTKTDLSYPFLCAERFTRITCDYYALKCIADRMPPGDKAREKTILDYAEIVIPRMRLENYYMINRLPSTLDYMKTSCEV